MKKIIITSAIVAMLAISSVTAYASADVTGNTGNLQGTATESTSVKKNGPLNIEYAKKTQYNADGSITLVIETWSNPATHAERLDFSEPDKGTRSLTRLGGAYVVDNGTNYIKYGKDSQGKLSGTSMKLTSLKSASILVTEYQEYVNEYKEGTRRAGWNDEGTVMTADGRVLNKITRSDMSTMPGEEGKTYIETVYLDKKSGLPVKGDIRIEQNSIPTLLYTYVYEFKNVSDDGSLFDINGINLKQGN